ncbi:MAG: tRNA glutamyl-Q(34) synthetase GluQRS [Sphingomonadaceae bacterium]
MSIVTRFAPSPTGPLHLGHAYSALLAHDHARACGGAFLLRIEDIDLARARPRWVEAIIEDLRWLGLDWDGDIVFQSRRLDVYAAALRELKSARLAYPCFCTRREIAAEVKASAAAPHGPEGPLYPGTCRGLPEEERAARLSAEPHSWRLDMGKALDRLYAGASPDPDIGEEPRADLRPGALRWHDAAAGRVLAEPARFGDVVVARKDAPVSYHLAVVVDDAAQGVSDVVRGRDLFAATHVHRLLQALLDLPVPRYHHHALLADDRGRRLAKRHGAPTLAGLRERGVDPRRLAADLRAGRLPAGYSQARV